MVGAGENNTLHAVATGGFVDMEDTADIRTEDLFKRTLYRDAAEMQDCVYTFNQLMNGLLVGEIAGLYFFAGVNGGAISLISDSRRTLA